ncbi:MAG: hypothetical protein EKK48_12145 [Candidatus Melainabacteria bacterium]|nr:MAG: hypothetical protein EKK48_12145 [Candidatus Melainabacteria bacterium]
MRKDLEGNILIHPSSLSNYQDCGRRTAVQIFREPIETVVGKERIRKTFPTIGSVVGNAVHAGVAFMLDRVRCGLDADLPAAVALGWAKYAADSFDGVQTDQTTRDTIQARIQIEKMINVFAHQIVPYDKFANIEEEMIVHVDGIFYVVGKPDGRTEYGVIHDHKTGVKLSSYWAQIGGYSVLYASHDIEVSAAQVNFCKRVKYDKPQPDIEIIPYNLTAAEDAYFDTVERVMRDYEAFSRTNSIAAFPANPASFMCSKKYCEAHSTPLCPYGKQTKSTGDEDID